MQTDTKPHRPCTLADALRQEDEALRRRVVHATRPRGPLSLEQARDLCRRMEGAANPLTPSAAPDTDRA